VTDVDKRQLKIGLPVEMTTRVLQNNGEHGVIVYGYKFRPSELS
jgi:uncharacterized OB-fold protein